MARKAPYMATLVGSVLCLASAVVVFLLAVTGVLFAKPTPPTDIGLYSITIILIGFGLGGLMLRRARMGEDTASGY